MLCLIHQRYNMRSVGSKFVRQIGCLAGYGQNRLPAVEHRFPVSFFCRFLNFDGQGLDSRKAFSDFTPRKVLALLEDLRDFLKTCAYCVSHLADVLSGAVGGDDLVPNFDGAVEMLLHPTMTDSLASPLAFFSRRCLGR